MPKAKANHRFETTPTLRLDARLSPAAIETLPVSRLKANPRNARTHSPAQIRQIARSIEAFGWTNPILADGEGLIVAGHGRVAAARLLGLRTVPVIRLDHLTPAQVRAYAIADNRLAEQAGWDRELLALELGDLSHLDVSLDLELTGFEMGEIDLLIEGVHTQGGQRETDEAADALPETASQIPATTRRGDLWRLGEHRLLCGDARDLADLTRLMDGALASALITDPPYNVAIPGFASGKGRTRHRNFTMASGEMSDAEFKTFLKHVLTGALASCNPDALAYVFMDWRHIAALVTAGEEIALSLLNVCVWVKPSGGMGGLYRNQHELVAVFQQQGAAYRNNVQLGRLGRNRTNVWHYAGPNSLTREGQADLARHPTVKPSALIADAIRDCTARHDLILDPFCGSGTALVAAEQTGRRARCLEIDPHYVDVSIRRWQDYTGSIAILDATGEAFAAVSEQRSGKASALSRVQGRSPMVRALGSTPRTLCGRDHAHDIATISPSNDPTCSPVRPNPADRRRAPAVPRPKAPVRTGGPAGGAGKGQPARPSRRRP